MLSTVAHWFITGLAAGLVVAAVLLATGVAGVWWVRRIIRRRLEMLVRKAHGYTLRTAVAASSGGEPPWSPPGGGGRQGQADPGRA